MSRQSVLGLLCWACVLTSSLLFLATATYAAPQGSGYHIVRRIPVGGAGNWDYLRVDPDETPDPTPNLREFPSPRLARRLLIRRTVLPC